MTQFKFKYLEVVERPAYLGLVVKRIDVSDLTRQERNKIWKKLDEEYSNDSFVTRLAETNSKLSHTKFATAKAI